MTTANHPRPNVSVPRATVDALTQEGTTMRTTPNLESMSDRALAVTLFEVTGEVERRRGTEEVCRRFGVANRNELDEMIAQLMAS